MSQYLSKYWARQSWGDGNCAGGDRKARENREPARGAECVRG